MQYIQWKCLFDCSAMISKNSILADDKRTYLLSNETLKKINTKYKWKCALWLDAIRLNFLFQWNCHLYTDLTRLRFDYYFCTILFGNFNTHCYLFWCLTWKERSSYVLLLGATFFLVTAFFIGTTLSDMLRRCIAWGEYSFLLWIFFSLDVLRISGNENDRIIFKLYNKAIATTESLSAFNKF